jgi:hypothetical protein
MPEHMSAGMICNVRADCLECGHADWDETHVFVSSGRCFGCELCAPDDDSGEFARGY